MKVARFVLKCAAVGLVVGAAVCAVVAYWDRITDAFYNLADKLEEKCANCCGSSEFDDYDDWENC